MAGSSSNPRNPRPMATPNPGFSVPQPTSQPAGQAAVPFVPAVGDGAISPPPVNVPGAVFLNPHPGLQSGLAPGSGTSAFHGNPPSVPDQPNDPNR
jgi:hypothetical protein